MPDREIRYEDLIIQDNNIPTEPGQKVLHIFDGQSPRMEEIFEKIHQHLSGMDACWKQRFVGRLLQSQTPFHILYVFRRTPLSKFDGTFMGVDYSIISEINPMRFLHRHALVASLRLIPYDMLTDLQRHQDFQFAKPISPAKEKKSLGTVPPCPKKEGRGFYLEFDKDAPL